MQERMQEWKEGTWRIHPQLNMRELNSRAVQFAVLDSDPVEQFKKSLLQNRERFRKELEAERDTSRRELTKRAHMTATWDGLFRAITGDHVYLLAPDNSASKELMATVTLISSNTPAGRKWFTTKVGHIKNSPVCWCIPQDVSVGKSTQVTLEKNNMLNLQAIYRELIEEGQS